MSIVLSRPRVVQSKVSITIDAADAHPFLKSGTFWADYGDLDISAVDPSLLILPALGTVLPISFATGVPTAVETVDRQFAGAAARLAPLWAQMYSAFAASDRSPLTGTRVTHTAPTVGGGSLLLYSGGVDSVTSLLRNRNAIRAIISVWGADIPLENETVWRQLSELTAAGELTRDLPRVTVRTNARDFVKQFRVAHQFIAPSSDWWGMVEHGLSLLSLCAPATAALGLDQVVIASTHTAAFGEPWGSSPATDELVKWTGTTVRHDSFDLSRQEKLAQYIVPYLQAGGHLDLAVCYQPGRGADGVNCGRCEKCFRTATGLLAAGGTPADAGLHIAPGGYESWRSQLVNGELTVANALFQWHDLQQGIPIDPPQRDPAIRDYLSWLRTLDLSQFQRVGDRKSHVKSEFRYQLRRGADQLPEPALQALRRLVGQWSRRGSAGASHPTNLTP